MKLVQLKLNIGKWIIVFLSPANTYAGFLLGLELNFMSKRAKVWFDAQLHRSEIIWGGRKEVISEYFDNLEW